MAAGGRWRVGREAAGVAAAVRAPESRRPGPRSCTHRRPRRHEPLQDVQVPAHGVAAVPSRGEPCPRVPAPPPLPPGPGAGTPEPACPGAPPSGPARRPGCSAHPEGRVRGSRGRGSLRPLRERRRPPARPPRPGTPEAVQPPGGGLRPARLPAFPASGRPHRGAGARALRAPAPPRSALPEAGLRERCLRLPWPWRVRVCQPKSQSPSERVAPLPRVSAGASFSRGWRKSCSSLTGVMLPAAGWGLGRPEEAGPRVRAEPGVGGTPRAPARAAGLRTGALQRCCQSCSAAPDVIGQA